MANLIDTTFKEFEAVNSEIVYFRNTIREAIIEHFLFDCDVGQIVDAPDQVTAIDTMKDCSDSLKELFKRQSELNSIIKGFNL